MMIWAEEASFGPDPCYCSVILFSFFVSYELSEPIVIGLAFFTHSSSSCKDKGSNGSSISFTLSTYLRFFSSRVDFRYWKVLNLCTYLRYGNKPWSQRGRLLLFPKFSSMYVKPCTCSSLFAPLLTCSLEISWSKGSISTSPQTELK